MEHNSDWGENVGFTALNWLWNAVSSLFPASVNNSNSQCFKVSCLLRDFKRYSFFFLNICLLFKIWKIRKIIIHNVPLSSISVIILIFFSSHFMHNILTWLRTHYTYNFVIYLIHLTLYFRRSWRILYIHHFTSYGCPKRNLFYRFCWIFLYKPWCCL